MKFVSRLVLAAWLIVTGLHAVIGLQFRYDNMVLGVLAVIAGIFLAVGV